MKKIVITAIILLVILYGESYSKKYRFTYDNSGNRITRTFLISKMAVEDTVNNSIAVKHEIKVYPNPTKGLITLNIANLGKDDEVMMTLHNINGDLIFSPTITDEESTINMSNHPNGTYFFASYYRSSFRNVQIVKME